MMLPVDILDQELATPKLFIESFRAANRVFDMDVTTDPVQFTRLFINELRSVKVPVKIAGKGRLVVSKTIWVWIAGPGVELEPLLKTLRSEMHEHATVLVGYVLQIGESLLWRRVQISTRWLLEKRNHDPEKSPV
jgi:hypothetical protein